MARIHLIKHVDIENTFWGIATSVWFNGCPHRCEGCWNKETWNIDKSLNKPNQEIIEEVLFALDEYIPKDLSLLGGEPLAPFNVKDTIEILSAIKTKRPQTRVLCWSGYTIDYLLKYRYKDVLKYIDILIDGKFMKELKVEGKKFGSSNQRVINVQESLRKNKIILWNKAENEHGETN